MCNPVLGAILGYNIGLQISNEMPDLHSGIDGGAIAEPMVDM